MACIHCTTKRGRSVQSSEEEAWRWRHTCLLCVPRISPKISCSEDVFVLLLWADYYGHITISRFTEAGIPLSLKLPAISAIGIQLVAEDLHSCTHPPAFPVCLIESPSHVYPSLPTG